MKLSLLTYKNPQLNTTIESYIHENPKEINKINSNGQTALIIALRYFEFSTLETIKILLKAGSNPNIEDDFGLTPVTGSLFAIEKGAPLELIQLLLDYGANPNFRGKYGLDCLGYLIHYFTTN